MVWHSGHFTWRPTASVAVRSSLLHDVQRNSIVPPEGEEEPGVDEPEGGEPKEEVLMFKVVPALAERPGERRHGHRTVSRSHRAKPPRSVQSLPVQKVALP